jgi:hypothetical protein
MNAAGYCHAPIMLAAAMPSANGSSCAPGHEGMHSFKVPQADAGAPHVEYSHYYIGSFFKIHLIWTSARLR